MVGGGENSFGNGPVSGDMLIFRDSFSVFPVPPEFYGGLMPLASLSPAPVGEVKKIGLSTNSVH